MISVPSSRLWIPFTAAVVLQGCGAGYTISKQATPNPFVAAAKFVAEPVKYAEGVTASSDIQNEVQSSWREEIGEELGGVTLVDAPEEGTPAIRITITSFKEGTAMNLQMDPAVLSATVQLVNGENVLDEITCTKVMSQPPASIGGIPMGGFTGAQRLGGLTDEIAEEVADYIKDRTKPAAQ
jgi:hypothetical protein